MRGREFLMKDAYSFDLDEAGARLSYYKQMLAYLRTFQRMGIQAVPMRAANGPIGGDLSHEFIVLAPTGESEVFYDAAYDQFDWSQADLNYADEAGLKGLFDRVNTTYAATDETHDEAKWAELPEASRRTGRGIEVGHIFYFGTKYSDAMGLKVSGPDGSTVCPHMGSYGVGVSRLVGAIIEASHDDNGIIWPDAVAPWQVGIVTMRGDDAASQAAASDLYDKLTAAGVETLYDDRDERGGAKLAGMDLMGLPKQVIIGPRGLAAGTVELKDRRTGEKQEISIESVLERLTASRPHRMILNRYERIIAKRYLLPGKGEGERFIFLVSMISLAAVALGVAALIIVMSVMNGFRAELFDKTAGLNGHAILQGYDGRLEGWQGIADGALKVPGVTSALPLIEQPLMASVQRPRRRRAGPRHAGRGHSQQSGPDRRSEKRQPHQPHARLQLRRHRHPPRDRSSAPFPAAKSA